MKLFERNAGKKTRGQTMVEFALVLPILLVTMYGIMEFGRLLFIYVTTASASREAARYAAAIGLNDIDIPFYNDCAGIREAAQRVGVLAGIQDSDVVIQYDSGPGTTPYSNCPAPGSGPGLGDRIIVSVTGHFNPVVPIVPISIRDIQSVTARTMVRDVTIGENFVSPPVVETPDVSPYVYFTNASTFVNEGETVTISIQTDVATTSEVVSVTVDVLDVMEAAAGYDYTWAGPYTLNFIPGASDEGDHYQYITIPILDDSLFENYERFVLYLRDVTIDGVPTSGRLGYPRFHIIRIIPDLADPMPEVFFYEETSSVSENRPEHRIAVDLNTPSGAPGWVNFNVIGISDPIGDEPQPGVDFTFSPAIGPNTGQLYFATSTTGARTTATRGFITINPIDNLVENDLRWIQIVLTDPFNLTLGSPIIHTVELIDNENCDIYFDASNPPGFTSDSSLTAYLINNGIEDDISWIEIVYDSTSGSNVHGISLEGNTLWADGGVTTSPFVLPSAGIDWDLSANLNLMPDAALKALQLTFSGPNVSQVDSFTMGFDICDPISFSNVTNTYIP
jgi:hypothetical protein